MLLLLRFRFESYGLNKVYPAQMFEFTDEILLKETEGWDPMKNFHYFSPHAIPQNHLWVPVNEQNKYVVFSL
jgi:hypothetical protein